MWSWPLIFENLISHKSFDSKGDLIINRVPNFPPGLLWHLKVRKVTIKGEFILVQKIMKSMNTFKITCILRVNLLRMPHTHLLEPV